jgi:hypothetical protein
MRIVGSKEAVGFVIDEHHPEGWIAVEIWAGGQCLTPVDALPYLPAFLPGLRASETQLRRPSTFLRHEGELSEHSIPGAFALLASDGAPELQGALRWLNWGPTTDDVLCFLVPSSGKLHLTWKLHGEPCVRSMPVNPAKLADLIAHTRRTLEDLSMRPTS